MHVQKNVLDIYFADKARAFPVSDDLKGFEDCCYWLFSDDVSPRVARARNDVPYIIVDGLNDKEKELVKQQIYERLKAGDFKEIYVVILVYWKEKTAIPLLKHYAKDFKIRNKAPHCDFSFEIRLCQDAIKMLQDT